jgi:outer membrane protein assembly factor BamB
LIALDAATGAKVWEKDTLIDHDHSYTITGAPRAFNGKVVIGQGGAEYGARGYITAYDTETGSGLALVHGARRSLETVRGRLTPMSKGRAWSRRSGCTGSSAIPARSPITRLKSSS